MSNDNTTNSFEELTFPFLLNKYDKILIPMIQRDYAQGRTTDKKAQEVRTNLLNDIFDEKKKCVHFDLIFGSCEKRNENDGEKRCFIPVDGQQRLTTLFLLYLYAQNVKRQKNDWDLSKFSYDTRRAAADFCKEVTATHWDVKSNEKVSDVIKNSVWFMNYWGNDPTVSGMLNMLDAIHEKANVEGTAFPNLDKVNFYFFDLESNGLNENLYLKMNSRGKPLTAFENLKASIEKILPNNIESDNPKKYFPENAASPKTFKDNWKFFMDRDWTNAFWNSEKPGQLDVNITAFIVRFLSGYWFAFGNESDNQTFDELKSINKKENYAEFIPFEPIKKVLETPEAFTKLAYALTTLANDSKIKAYWCNDSETIEASKKAGYTIIAVIFAYVIFDGDEKSMRFAWNMAENYVTGLDNFIKFCKYVKVIHDYSTKKKVGVYQTLTEMNFEDPSAQLKEEIDKAKKILSDNEWESKIIEAEKYAFFKGAIRFLFTDGNGEINWEDFDAKWENAQKYFDRDGVKNSDGDRSIFIKLLLCISEFKLLYEFYYDDSIKNWRQHILLNSNLAKCVNDLLLDSEPADRTIWPDSQQAVFSDLTESDFLLGIPEDFELDKQSDKYLLTKKGKGNGQENKKYFIGIIRNHLLSNLFGGNITVEKNNEQKIFTDQKNTKCDFFWGWNINFKYHNHFFQWYGNPQDNNPNNDGRKELDVYLMIENWDDYCPRKVTTSDKKTENGTHYCFKVTDNNPSLFTDALDSLINEAIKNGDLQSIAEQ